MMDMMTKIRVPMFSAGADCTVETLTFETRGGEVTAAGALICHGFGRCERLRKQNNQSR